VKVSKEKLCELINQLPEGETQEAGYIYSFIESIIKKESKKKLSDIARMPFIVDDKIILPPRDERNER
jgi:hypothetical protein